MKRHRHMRKRWFPPQTRRRLLLGGGVVLAVFILVNLALAAVYHNRTYPRTKVMGHTIGSVAYGALPERLQTVHAIPATVHLEHDQQNLEFSLADAGIYKDISRTVNSANKQRSWLPIINLFRPAELQAPIAFDQAKLHAKADLLANSFHKDATNAHLVISGDSVGIAAAQPGYDLDTSRLQAAITAGLDKAQATVTVPTVTVQPKIQADSLKDKKTDLEAQLKTNITYTFASKSKKASSADITGWYIANQEGGYSVGKDKVAAYITATAASFGIKPKNGSQLASNTEQALARHQAYTGAIEQQIALKTFTYCTAVRGVDTANLPALRSKAAESFTSDKGWSVGGLVDFKEVSAGCDFTIWLTAASQMPSFGAICDPMWSCRVGSNVVINFDRWQNASPAWNAAGLGLDTYRNMAINHETGHWLGFEHSGCPGAGQPAPVMEQQSVDLQGCTFNAWPTATEIATLRRTLGI